MENGNSKSEEMDKEFLEELNSLTKQLKTDEEIQKDLKLNQSKNKEDKTKEKDNDDNNINENPFSEAFNEINSKNPNFFDFENNGLIFDSLNLLTSEMNKFSSTLNDSLNLNKKEGEKDKNENEINEKQNQLLEEILDFLIQSNLLKDTVLKMKKSIDDSLEKNKNNLKPEENQKYDEAISNADNILNEMSKIHPDKGKILDSLQNLQKISNDIESIFKI